MNNQLRRILAIIGVFSLLTAIFTALGYAFTKGLIWLFALVLPQNVATVIGVGLSCLIGFGLARTVEREIEGAQFKHYMAQAYAKREQEKWKKAA